MKYFTIIMLHLFILNINAQDLKLQKNNNYKIEIIKCGNEISNGDKFATLKWDFTNVNENTKIEIEVIGILDCFNGIDGTSFRSDLKLLINEIDLKKIDETKLFHKILNVKCFKWRVKLTNVDSIDNSEWSYFSFLNKN